MQARPTRRLFAVLLCAASLTSVSALEAQTYRQTWTTTDDFEQGAQINVNATDPRDQLQLNLGQIETPYLWIANTYSDTVTKIDTATGRAESVTTIPTGGGPSRTAVDLDFNCWVAVRLTGTGVAHKLRASDGALIDTTQYVGRNTRGVAINAAGEVWISSSVSDANQGGFGWMKVDSNSFQPLETFVNDIGSYGIAIDPYGRMFSTTSWLGGRSVQRFDGVTGELQQRWRVQHRTGNIYGFTVDIDGDVWGAYWSDPYVAWIDGDHQCPNNGVDCNISPGNGIIRDIDVRDAVQAAGGSANLGGRGVAVDANRFVWAVFNDLSGGGWEQAPSYAVKIDGTSGEPIRAVPTGRGSVGITPDANGFIWVVNYGGGGANFQSSYTCPNGYNPSAGGTVTKLRSSDGSVVATYPTCGDRPYTYSDMAGYNLRSVTLRSGTWRVTHDSGRPGLEWERINWRSQETDDTTFRIRVRAAGSAGALASQPFVTVSNNDDMPLNGQFIEVEAFLFTRNDSFGPILEDLTISSVCEPEPEVCDGFDNNCDGQIDNGNPGGGQACDTGLVGICARGVRTCVNGVYECAVDIDPQVEVCNGEDDNCDGRIDEGVVNLCGTCGPVPTEVCDGEDNDCDGIFDEGVLNACGECGPPPTETCNGEDDDCDGLVDEGLLNACGECGPPPEEICNGVDDDCDILEDEGVVNACGECGPAPEEVCDGLDNNCDGRIDEGLINRCGTCGPAPEEECNGLDDDCDGRIDENVLNPCGLCGPTPAEVCDGLDNNCDGNIDEGLTNACGSCGELPTEICNGFDDDCDGETDEGVLNACGGCGLLPEEVCDLQDNDCDGQVDENVLNACGGCGELGPDLCDGVDSDCDGELDEDPECVEGRTCVAGECAEPCAQGECPRGFVCVEDYCLVDECIGRMCGVGELCYLGECFDESEFMCRNVSCEGETTCIQGECVEDPCPGMECGEGQACWQGECLDDEVVACRQADCGPGQLCEGGVCVDDPCAAVSCPSGEVCNEGVCEDACLSTVCSAGYDCAGGLCVRNPCADVQCQQGQVCQEGNCVWEACVDVSCGPDEQCGEQGCEPLGSCGDAVCAEGEACFNGACLDEATIEDITNGGGGGGGGSGSGGGGGGSGGAEGGEESCACSSVSGRPRGDGLPGWPMLLLGLIAATVTTRRR